MGARDAMGVGEGGRERTAHNHVWVMLGNPSPSGSKRHSSLDDRIVL